jgi:hypothetical protein
MLKNANLFESKSDEEVQAYFQFAFRVFALSTKHPGFHEEQEWRIIYSAQIEETTRLIRRTVVVRGMPQIIYEIPLANIPEENFIGGDAGLKDPESKVFVSNIPLRQ